MREQNGEIMITRVDMANHYLAMEEYFATQTSTRKAGANVYAGGDCVNNVVNYANGTKIITGNNNDTVTNIAGGAVIDTQGGDDSIISVGMGTEIYAGAGNDKIYSQYGNTKIDKGTGCDNVYIIGSNINVSGGNDDLADSILSPSFSFLYVKNQGLLLNMLYGNQNKKDDDDYETEINIYYN